MRPLIDVPGRTAGDSPRRQRPSLWLRTALWNLAIVAATLALLTAVTVSRERAEALAVERAWAQALVEHLVAMPQFREAAEAGAVLRVLSPPLRSVGGRLEMSEAGVQPPPNSQLGPVLASEPLALPGAPHLVYRADPGRLAAAARRSTWTHASYGLAAWLALAIGSYWILRWKLVAPLGRLTRQLEHIREGRGWLTPHTETDSELRPLAAALAGLGPKLAEQVAEWVEAERRAAVALTSHDARRAWAAARARIVPALEALRDGSDAPRETRDAVGRVLHELDGIGDTLLRAGERLIEGGAPRPDATALGSIEDCVSPARHGDAQE